MVKVKQLMGEVVNNGVSDKNYVEVTHELGRTAEVVDDGGLIVLSPTNGVVAGYAVGHWASYVVER